MKKKRGLLIIVLMILILLIGGAAAFGYAYLKTDIFKTTDELFWKYLSKNKELFVNLKNENSAEQIKALKDKNYSFTGSITTSMEGNDEKKVVNATTSGRYDSMAQRLYKDITLKNEADSLTVSYINNRDFYAIKNDDVLPYYFGIKNSGLKQLADEYIEDSITKVFIPDSINLEGLNLITEQDIENLSKTYFDVIKQTIPKEKYEKNQKVSMFVNGTNYNANEYIVNLEGQEVKTIIANSLEKAKTDATTINIAKRIAESFEQEFSNEEYVDGLNGLIHEGLEEDEMTINIKVKVYENNGNLIKTVIEIQVPDYTLGENKYTISIDNLSSSERKNAIITLKIGTDEEEFINMKLDVEKRKMQDSITRIITITPDISNNPNENISLEKTLGNIYNNKIKNSVAVTMNSEGIQLKSIYSKDLEIGANIEEIMEVKDNNSIILNNYKKNQIAKLYETTISKKLTNVINKLQNMGIDLNNYEYTSMFLASGICLANGMEESSFSEKVTILGYSIMNMYAQNFNITL